MVRPEVIEDIWRQLNLCGWQTQKDEVTGKVVGATRPREDIHKSYNLDVITTECGYSTIEIAQAPAPSLMEAERYLQKLIASLTTILEQHRAYLIGYGVQPRAAPSHSYQAPKGRYELLYQIWRDEHPHSSGTRSPDLHCLNAATQAQIEVTAEEAIPALNALNATSGLRIALLANSPIWSGKRSDYKAIRQIFWNWCWPERRQQFGIPITFQNLDHYLEHLFDFRGLAARRNGQVYWIDNHQSFRQLYLTGSIQGRLLDGEEIVIEPEVQTDIGLQSSFAWFDARLQPLYGTIEDRIACQQPPQEHLCASALTLGLVENARPLIEMANQLSLDQWREIRNLACIHGLSFQYPGVDSRALVSKIVEIARQGLRMRGLGEEIYLSPLDRRLESGQGPADQAIAIFNQEGITGLIRARDMRHWSPTSGL